ncbi:glycosyltransferase family 29 protein [Ohtaekwangia kribbensis]|jgi:hypothetical protein|uniref:Glycosyltransferase family 29 protein n=1 Tax=Ohtaekwangia kribbensis TaxID=688913 RepID=A0ABW3KAF3_9BACT
MKFLIKLYRALLGFVLMLRFTKRFDKSILEKKRIAIVGPASSAMNTNRGEFIDAFDFVIRINKSPLVVRDGKFKKDIGSKIDILFHSFFENEFSGGGPLDFNLYNQQGIRYVINPIPTYFGWRVTFNFYKKYLLSQVVYYLPSAPYKQVIGAFGKFRPTTGFCALKEAMESDFSELFITGFTFFKTAYGDGYRDALKDVNVNKKYIVDSNIHNPDIEYEQFIVMLKANPHKTIFVDKELKQILLRDGIVVNEAPDEV